MTRRVYTPLCRVVALVMTLAILHPGAGFAQINVTPAALSGGGTVTGPILFPDGTEAAPSIAFSGAPTTGFWRPGGNIIGVNSVAGSTRFAFFSGIFNVASGGAMGFSSSTNPETNTADTFWNREGAAIVQYGDDANGAVVAYTIKGADGITGTDIAGAPITYSSGRGTGAGAVSTITFSTPTLLGTGTTAQTNTARLTLGYEGASFPGSAPTVTSCGVTPSAVTGSNVAGRLTTGSGGTLQSCTLTFVPARTAAPSCVANDETAIILLRATATTTTLVIDSAVAGTMESDVINYVCF